MHALQQLLRELLDTQGGIAVARGIHFEGEQVCRLDADIHGAEVGERPDEERRSHQQQQRDGDLRCDERLPQTRAAAQHGAGFRLQRRRQVGASRLKRRRQTKEHTRQHGDGERECQDACIRQRRHDRRGAGIDEEIEHERSAGYGNGEAGDSAGKRQQHAFKEQLLHEPTASRAEREPHRHLALPAGGSREQEIRDVRACDDEHRTGNRHQRPEWRGHCASEARMSLRSRGQDQPILQVTLASRRRSRREARRAQVQSQERSKVRLQRGFGLCLRDARLQASEHAHPAIQAIVECVPPWRHLRFHHHRDEHLRGFADVDAVESLLRHADDREGLAVDDRLATDYGRIGREPRAPVRVA